MLVLVKAKWVQFIEELEADDLPGFDALRDDKVGINFLVCKCKASDHLLPQPKGLKYKWHILLPEYKQVADLHKDT